MTTATDLVQKVRANIFSENFQAGFALKAIGFYMSQIFFKKENQRAAVVAQVAKQWTIELWDKDSNPACFQSRLFSKIRRCLKFLALSTGSRQILSSRFSVK